MVTTLLHVNASRSARECRKITYRWHLSHLNCAPFVETVEMRHVGRSGSKTSRRAPCARASSPGDKDSDQDRTTSVPSSTTEMNGRQNIPTQNRVKAAESTDWVATQLTRRFGIAGGLAWLGLLTFGVVSEQLKTRYEVATEESEQRDVAIESQREVEGQEGLRYVDQRIGGGSVPSKGLLVVLHFRAYADGELFEDTYARGKPIVYLYGTRPHPGGTCAGVEMALRSMKAGGIRKVTVPPELGFGRNGTSLRPTEHVPGKSGEVPPNATLTYELELVRVSIPPS